MATAAATSPSKAIVFYDIAQRPPVEQSACATNPWKSRLALNFKAVPYSTNWVRMPDIDKVRSGLGVPPGRKFADGRDFNTLPIIHDLATDTLVGDSFDIAIYLQKTYSESGAGDLFPPQTLDFVYECPILIPLSDIREGPYPDYARFNNSIDAVFTSHSGLMVQGIPFDPATAEQTQAEFVRRAGVSCWDDLKPTGEARNKMLESFRNSLADLARLFARDTSGPFLLGQQASYADFIVGGWLRMMSVTMPKSEWEDARTWHNGVFGKAFDAMDQYAQMK